MMFNFQFYLLFNKLINQLSSQLFHYIMHMCVCECMCVCVYISLRLYVNLLVCLFVFDSIKCYKFQQIKMYPLTTIKKSTVIISLQLNIYTINLFIITFKCPICMYRRKRMLNPKLSYLIWRL